MFYDEGSSISKFLSFIGSLVLGNLGVVAFLCHGKALAHSYESNLCIHATGQAERALQIPDGFLSAISRVETGRPDNDGTIAPWPWTVTAAGVGHFYATREQAIEAVKEFRRQGIFSLDVGCMQVNLQQHPDAFVSVQQAFDPMYNAHYAGEFLLRLYAKTGSWPHAAAAYHSQTPSIGLPYQWKVLEAWSEPQDKRFVQKAFVRRAGISRAEYNAAYNKESIESRVAIEAKELKSLSSLPFVTVSTEVNNRVKNKINNQSTVTLYGESPEIPISYARSMHAYFQSHHRQNNRLQNNRFYADSSRHFRPYVENTRISGVSYGRAMNGRHDRRVASYRISPVALAAIASSIP